MTVVIDIRDSPHPSSEAFHHSPVCRETQPDESSPDQKDPPSCPFAGNVVAQPERNLLLTPLHPRQDGLRNSISENSKLIKKPQLKIVFVDSRPHRRSARLRPGATNTAGEYHEDVELDVGLVLDDELSGKQSQSLHHDCSEDDSDEEYDDSGKHRRKRPRAGEKIQISSSELKRNCRRMSPKSGIDRNLALLERRLLST